MKIGVVIEDEALALEVVKGITGMGHSVTQQLSISQCSAEGAQMVFAYWRVSRFAQGLLEVERNRGGKPSPPVVVLVPEDSFHLISRAKKAGATDALLCPVPETEIRAEIESVNGSSAPFDPVERERFERFCEEKLIGNDPMFRQCLHDARRAARTNANVLLLGESGTGKDLVAQLTHHLSWRSTHPFTAVNCSAIATELAETELFGSVRGAFTGAESRIGLFGLVGEGTIFLDEIGVMQLHHQAKLLRVLDQHEFRRVGSSETTTFNGRVICATSTDLDKAVEKGEFRRDLFGRINQFRIAMPPLRERRDDIAELAMHFARKHAPGRGVSLGATTLKLLERRQYPENLRGLENTVLRALANSGRASVILPQHLPDEAVPFESMSQGADEGVDYKRAREQAEIAVDRAYLGRLLEKHRGNYRAVSREAGIDHKTLAKRVAAAFPEWGLVPDE